MGMCSSAYQAVMSSSTAGGTEMATIITAGAGPSSSGPSELTCWYTRRSSVAIRDITDFSRALADAASALYSGLSVVPYVISYSASHGGSSPSIARYRYAAEIPGTVSRAGPCSLSYQSLNSSSGTDPGSV